MNRLELGQVSCYGSMSKYHNIEVTCEDEEDDYLYPDGFDTWEEAVFTLAEKHVEFGLSAPIQMISV